MAQYLNTIQAHNFEVDGKWFDLIKLIDASEVAPEGWVSPEIVKDLKVGQIAYVHALGRFRRGVVTKLGRTKATVAYTTQGAVDDAVRYGSGNGVRVGDTPNSMSQILIPAPKVQTPEQKEEAEYYAGLKAELEAERQTPVDLVAQMDPANIPTTRQCTNEWHRTAPARETILCPECPSPAQELTPNSQDCKVGPDSEDDNTEEPEMTAQTETAPEPTTIENHTGSTVVATLEKVWTRIRADHPELPEVVIITGSGLVGGSKWGHFRAEGWKVREEGAALRKHELFLAGEALAKGAPQVLQTMLHEAAHTLAKVRDLQDTSRQGRWHNGTFRKLAEEMGLEHKGSSADSAHGFSFVTLTKETTARYADLLLELDREIRLVCHLPTWLGGSSEGDEPEGGEKITGKAPKGEDETKPQSGNLKATCNCPEPNIIRVSRKVLDKRVVQCDECDSLFMAA